MKILLAVPFWGCVGGKERYIIDCITEFARLGHLCSIIYGEELPIDHNTPLPNVMRYHMPTYSAFRSNLDASMVKYLSTILETEKPHVIFLTDLKNFALLSLLQQYGHLVPMSHDNFLVCLRTSNVTYITRKSCTHRMGYRCLLHGCFLRKAKSGCGLTYNNLVTHKALLAIYRRIGVHLTPGNYTKNRLVQNGFRPEDVQVVGYFTDVRPLSPVPPPYNVPTVLFVGRIDRYKGLDYMLHALALVSQPFRCMIIGDGEYLGFCRRLALTSGINRRIEFLGWLPREDIVYHLCRASLVVVPSLGPESLGLVGIEAMMCSRPVVAFDSGAIRDWLKDGSNGYLVPVKEVHLLAKRINDLLENPQRAAIMGEEGRRFVSRTFSKEKHIKRLISIFEEASRRDQCNENRNKVALSSQECQNLTLSN
jgi:glycosyltransferase involved in cell wall biosynthesis